MRPVRCDRGLTVLPTDTPATIGQPDLIVVPGSENPLPGLGDRRLIEWLARAAPGCQWTASVCTGAGLYAAAGLLDGKTVTTHWGFRDNLRAMGVTVSADRVVWQDRHISGAGVSAGIDMALALTDRVYGRPLAETLQLVIEYDPQPPFDCGAPDKADASTLRLALRVLLGDRPLRYVAEMQRHAARARLTRAYVAASRLVCAGSSEGELDDPLAVDARRVEDGNRRVVRSHEQIDLGAAEQDSLGATVGQLAHDAAVLLP